VAKLRRTLAVTADSLDVERLSAVLESSGSIRPKRAVDVVEGSREAERSVASVSDAVIGRMIEISADSKGAYIVSMTGSFVDISVPNTVVDRITGVSVDSKGAYVVSIVRVPVDASIVWPETEVS
jgi:hypothetical protein